MHSSAQATFSAIGQAPLALLDMEAGLQIAASPLEVDMVETNGFGKILQTTPLNFLVWPMEYLQVDMVDATTFRVSEFGDSVVASDLVGFDPTMGDSFSPLGDFLKKLCVTNTFVGNGPEECKSTIYTVAAGSRTIHKPTLRYQVLWISNTFSASGAIRATQAGTVNTASAIPVKYPYYWSGA